jgi:ankyrin repeat protein
LLDAAAGGDIPRIDRLLNSGIDVNAAYFEGLRPLLSLDGTWKTAIVVAAEYGQFQTVEHLLDRGADPTFGFGGFGIFYNMDLTMCPCECPPQVKNSGNAVMRGNPVDNRDCANERRILGKLVLRVLECENAASQPSYLQISAVKTGDAQVVSKVGLRYPEFIYNSEKLDLAATLGYVEVVAELLTRISDIRSLTLATADAISCEHPEVALLLIEHGAHVDTVDQRGRTLLHLAASQGNADLVKNLIKRGARSDLRDRSNKLPGDYAADEATRQALIQSR